MEGNMEYDVKPKNLTRQEKGFPQTIPQLIQKYKLDALWENIEKSIKDIIQQELGKKAIKGTSLTVKGIDGEEGFIQVLDSEDKPVVEINNKGVEVGEGKTITEGGNEVNKSIKWEDIQEKPNTYPPQTHTHNDYKVKGDFAIATGKIIVYAGDQSFGTSNISYPEGFNKDNCVVLSVGVKLNNYYQFGGIWIGGLFAELNDNNISVTMTDVESGFEIGSYDVKVVLMKI